MISSDIIVAEITPRGRGAVSTLRISGEKIALVINQISSVAEKIISNPRKNIFAKFIANNKELDDGLFCFYQSPKSYTGEEILEISLHASPFIIKTALEEILSIKGVRLAKAGEFTERAFLNGKLDLSQAEAVSDLINSESEIQARSAHEQLNGKLSQAIIELGTPLRELAAEIEAYIDFPDEGIEPETEAGWIRRLDSSMITLNRYIKSYQVGKIYRDGAKVSLVGLPNAGKSSLLNFLLGEDRAIVTDIPGTTRDVIEEKIIIDGYLIRLVDTAGLEIGDRKVDLVEQLGIERTMNSLKSSDLVIYLSSAAEKSAEELSLINKINELNSNVLEVQTKADISSDINSSSNSNNNLLSISIKDGFESSIDNLKREIIRRLSLTKRINSPIIITNIRHQQALTDALSFLTRAYENIEDRVAPEIVTLDIRDALNSLTEIVGATHNEDILDLVFTKFCIGK